MKRWMQGILSAGLLVQVAACGPSSTPEAKAEAAGAQATAAHEIDWKAVDAAMGRSGSRQAGGVYRFGMPRTDLSVTSKRVQIQAVARPRILAAAHHRS